MMSSSVARTAARRLIRSLPQSSSKTTYSNTAMPSQAISMAMISNHLSLVDLASSWTPPELDFIGNTSTSTTKRDFVWHAGQMQAQEAEELHSAIHDHMVEMMSMIAQLPKASYGSNHASNNNNNPMVQRILQKEQTILNLCQQYQQLTGEAYEELPPPHCDESATVLKMA